MIGLIFGRGAEGLPPPVPLDFSALPTPASPNWWVALPPGESGPAGRSEAHALPPVEAAAVWGALLGVAERMPRCTLMAAWPERWQAQWVVRSRLMNFPDIVVAEVVARPGGAGLWLHSRSLLGWSDMGVNRARVGAWLAALDAALAQAGRGG